MVEAGLVSSEASTIGLMPSPLPPKAELLLCEGDEALALQAISQLDWSDALQYSMYRRKITSWVSRDAVLMPR